jgi:centromeric protein E
LQPSLSGDALISVICTLSPSPLNLNESLSTLSFAQGLKRVVLRAQRNQVLDPQALIQQYQQEIAELKAMLKGKASGALGAGNAVGMKTLDEGNPRAAGMAEAQKKTEIERRLEELKSMIITGGTVGDGEGSSQVSAS